MITVLDAMQPRLFYMIFDGIYLNEVTKIPTLLERKACAIAMIKLLAECPILLEDSYFSLWPKVLATLIRLFEAPEEETELLITESNNSTGGDEDDGGDNVGGYYNTMYAHLTYAGRPPHDALKTIEDPKLFLAKSLHELSRAHPGRFPPVINRLPEESVRFLNHYFQRAGVHAPS